MNKYTKYAHLADLAYSDKNLPRLKNKYAHYEPIMSSRDEEKVPVGMVDHQMPPTGFTGHVHMMYMFKDLPV